MQKANYKIYKNKILKIRLFITVIFTFFAASIFAQNRIIQVVGIDVKGKIRVAQTKFSVEELIEK